MQATNNILLVRPSNFIFNTETETSNAFQVKIGDSEDIIKQKAFLEFEAFANILKLKGVNVYVFDDTKVPQKPDAVFPNNWVTFHWDGTVIFYPMYAPNRQWERRLDIIDNLKQNFKVTQLVDLSKYEIENRFWKALAVLFLTTIIKLPIRVYHPAQTKRFLLKFVFY